MAENSVSYYLALQDENTTSSAQTQFIKSLEFRRLNNKLLEEQYIHHFNLIKYLIESSTEWEKVKRLLYSIRPKGRFMQSVIKW